MSCTEVDWALTNDDWSLVITDGDWPVIAYDEGWVLTDAWFDVCAVSIDDWAVIDENLAGKSPTIKNKYTTINSTLHCTYIYTCTCVT